MVGEDEDDRRESRNDRLHEEVDGATQRRRPAGAGSVVTTGDQSTKPETNSSASVAALHAGRGALRCDRRREQGADGDRRETDDRDRRLLTNASAESIARGLVSRAARGAGIDSRNIGAATSTSKSRWTTRAVSDQCAARSSSGQDSATRSSGHARCERPALSA